METSSFDELIEEENRHLEEQKRRARRGEVEAVREEAQAHADVQVETASTMRHMDQILAITTHHLDADDLYAQILERLRTMLDVDGASILLVGDGGKSLFFRASDGLEEAVVRGIRIPMGSDHAGRVASSGRAAWWTDLAPEDLVNPVLRERGITSLADVPIHGDEGVIGVLEVSCRPRRRFDETEVGLLQIAAHHVGLAIGRAAMLAELRAARQRAEEANRFKTTLIQMLTHDLKTPLSAISMQVQLIASDKLPEDSKDETIERVQSNLEMLQLMMDDFLDMARIDADRFTFQPRRLDVAKVVQDVLALYSARAAGSQVELRYSGGSVEAEVDERRLRQVLANLLSNAIRYNEPQGRVSVAARREDDELVLQVRDTGRGMTHEQLRRASRPFAQLHGTRSERQGAGLGLHLSRLIIEEQGGSLRLESPGPGLGTTVTVRLPA